MFYNLKVYVGCGLSCAPEKFKAEVERFKKVLEEFCHVLHFLGLTAGTANDVYEYDIVRCVGECDLLVAVCDEPSTGLGYEIATQVERHGKPVLAVAHRNSKVTRLLQDPQKPGYEFCRYDDLVRDVPAMVIKRLEEISQQAALAV